LRSLVGRGGFSAVFGKFSKRLGSESSSESRCKLGFSERVVLNIGEGVCVMHERDGLIRYVNPRFETMFGYEAGEVEGLPFTALIAPTNISPLEKFQEISALLRRDGFWRGEALTVKKSGAQLWTELSISEFHDPVWGLAWLSIIRDISEQKSNEALVQAQQAKVDASARLAILAELAANLSHEINNPLAIIRATAEDLSDLLRQKQLDEATLQKGLDRIERTIERIANTIRSLRTSAEIDMGKK
jgi:PAS domain S-box-containing protein